MGRIGQDLDVDVRSDVNIADIEVSCSDSSERITEVVDLPTVGVNTERIWLMEHFTDWLSVSLGRKGTYHKAADASQNFIAGLPNEKSMAVAPDSDIIGGGRSQPAGGEADTARPAGMHAGAGSVHADAGSVTVRKVHERLDAIEYRHRLYKPAMQVLASAVSCASFTFLLGRLRPVRPQPSRQTAYEPVFCYRPGSRCSGSCQYWVAAFAWVRIPACACA